MCEGRVAMINEETPQDRVLQSSNWGIDEFSNNPGFLWQTQCNLLVPNLLLGLGFRVCFLFGHVFCSQKIKYTTILHFYEFNLALSFIFILLHTYFCCD